jgi:phage gpG-like protein
MITVTVYGTEIARKKLGAMARVMAPDRRELNHRNVGIQLHGDVMRTFIADGATFGRPKWEPLKPSTLAGRVRKSPVRSKLLKMTAQALPSMFKILRDTGALQQSFVPLSDEKLAGVGAVSFYSPIDREDHGDLAPIHQFGSPAKNIPPRPMLPTEDQAMKRMTQVYGLMIEKAVKS